MPNLYTHTALFLLVTLLLTPSTLSQPNPIVEGKKVTQTLTFENFEHTVQKGNKNPYFIMFKMTGCGACKRIAPTFFKLAFDLKDEPVTFATNNVKEDAK